MCDEHQHQHYNEHFHDLPVAQKEGQRPLPHRAQNETEKWYDKHTDTRVMQEFVNAVTGGTIAENAMLFISTIRQLSSPVDCYLNNEIFRGKINSILHHDLILKWGRKASHYYKHAYTLKYAQDEGAYYTIQTNIDFAKIDPNFPWLSHDLFEDEYQEIK